MNVLRDPSWPVCTLVLLLLTTGSVSLPREINLDRGSKEPSSSLSRGAQNMKQSGSCIRFNPGWVRKASNRVDASNL